MGKCIQNSVSTNMISRTLIEGKHLGEDRDGQFMQLRSKQISDGIIQGTEALAQGVAFGVSGVVTKPMESARQNGLLGLAHGLGRAALGIIVQPVSGALDFFSLTVGGIGASCTWCLEILNNKTTSERIRNPRAIHADNIVREYCEREAVGQICSELRMSIDDGIIHGGSRSSWVHVHLKDSKKRKKVMRNNDRESLRLCIFFIFSSSLFFSESEI